MCIFASIYRNVLTHTYIYIYIYIYIYAYIASRRDMRVLGHAGADRLFVRHHWARQNPAQHVCLQDCAHAQS